MAKRVDANQPEIVDTLRRAGLHVDHTHEIGGGFPDLIVTGYSARADSVLALLVEVKTPNGTLTPAEQVFHQDYPADGPLLVAYSAEEILAWFGR